MHLNNLPKKPFIYENSDNHYQEMIYAREDYISQSVYDAVSSRVDTTSEHRNDNNCSLLQCQNYQNLSHTTILGENVKNTTYKDESLKLVHQHGVQNHQLTSNLSSVSSASSSSSSHYEYR
ncbi:unnamed protein product [Heterobilharzia americana]|nr:unnamed protein product [Heterobilharzia americana]